MAKAHGLYTWKPDEGLIHSIRYTYILNVKTTIKQTWLFRKFDKNDELCQICLVTNATKRGQYGALTLYATTVVNKNPPIKFYTGMNINISVNVYEKSK